MGRIIGTDGQPLVKGDTELVVRLLYIEDADGAMMLDIPDTPERTIMFPVDYHHRFTRAAEHSPSPSQRAMLLGILKLLDEIVAQREDGETGANFITIFSELVAKEIGDPRTIELFTEATAKCAEHEPDKWLSLLPKKETSDVEEQSAGTQERVESAEQ